METETHAVGAADDLYEVIRTLIEESVTGAPVVDEDRKVVGMITEAHCLRLISHGDAEGDAPFGTVRDFMGEAIEVKPTMDIYYVAGLFNAHPDSRRFAVVDDDGRLVAVVTRKDILKVVHSQLMKSPSMRAPRR